MGEPVKHNILKMIGQNELSIGEPIKKHMFENLLVEMNCSWVKIRKQSFKIN
jgi:hypothetical protein